METNRSTAVRIILDTDIGPDCDDAGAVAVLHALARRGEAEIAGVMHCTSSRWGAGCLDALNAHYGRPDIPVGTLKREGFLNNDAGYEKYNKGVALQYPNRYKEAAAPDAVKLYRELLAAGEDGGTVIAAIGPLPNLMDLLQSGPDEHSSLDGSALVARKVKQLVVMGGNFPNGKEWNFEMHPESAAFVASQWSTPIAFTGFEIGLAILTGRRLFTDLPADHPVRLSYAWYVGEGQARPSWDLTAVLYAVRGAAPYWELVQGRIVVDGATGANDWQDDEQGPHAYLRSAVPAEQAAEALDALMVE